MATILQPAPVGGLAVAIQTNQPVRLVSDEPSWNWFVRTNEGTWSQFASGTAVAVWGGATSVTNRLTFDRVEIAIGSGATPDTGTTRRFDLCEGPVPCLWISGQVRNEAMEEPPLRPWEGEDDDPPLGVPLAMPGANRDRLGTVLCETVSEPGGPANLVASFGSGAFVDTAGKLGVRTPFTSDVRGLGPFPAVAAWYHGGLYFQHDFGKSRTLGLTRVLYQDGAGHAAVVRGDGRRNTYRELGGGAYDRAANHRNTLSAAGGVFEETTPSGRVYRYDSNGRLQRVIDQEGQPVYYQYDANARLQKIDGLPGQNALGLVPYLSYDGSGLLTRLVLEDPSDAGNNRTTYFSYDGDRNLTEIRGAEGCVTSFEYQDPRYLAAVEDAEGYRWYFRYDGSTRVNRVDDALGQATYLAWDPAAPLSTVRDRVGKATYFRFNAFGAPYQVENPGTAADYHGYDGEGNLVLSRNRLGNAWAYEYDPRGNRIAVTDPLGARSYFAYDGEDLLRAYTDPLARTVTLDYDGERNRTKLIDQLGNTAYYEYEGNGLLRWRKDRRGAMTYFAYDGRGNLTQATDDLGQVSRMGFNSANEATAQVDPLGRVTYAEYDLRGRVSHTRSPIAGWSYFLFDARCNLVQQTDALGRHTYHTYDGNQNRTRTLPPAGDDGVRNPSYWTYDGEDRPLRQVNARSFASYFEYDALGRLQRQKDAYANATYVTYDEAHQVVAQLDKNQNPTYMEYDPTGRVNRHVNAWFNATYFGFNLAGERVLTVDARQNATYFEYDPRGWQRRTETAIGAVSYVVFDAEGSQLRSIDPLGLTTYFTYDKLGRQTHTRDQLGGVSYTGYDAASQAALRVDELGAATYMTYDLAGRSQTTLDPAGLLTYLQYDLVGNLLGQTLEQGWGQAPWGSSPYDGERATTYFRYDGLNRRTTTIDPYQRYSYVGYDRGSNVYFTIDARRYRTYYLYDRLDRRTHTSDPAHFLKTYMGYDAAGNHVVSLDQQGFPVYLQYDRLNRQYYVFDKQATRRTYFNYDQVGNQIAKHDLWDFAQLASTYFQFDRVNRMSREIAADGGHTYYGHDLAGNQVLAIDPVGRATYMAYDELNRTLWRSNALGYKTYFEYDARSSTIKEVDPEGRTSYMAYDAARRLLLRSNSLWERTYMFHDARGQRTQLSNPRGYTTYWRYDLLSRNTHRQHALGGIAYTGYDEVGNVALRSDELGHSTYFEYDGLNMVRNVRDQAGGVTYFGYTNRNELNRRVDADGRTTYLAWDSAHHLSQWWYANPVAGETTDSPSYFSWNNRGDYRRIDERVGGLGFTYFSYDPMGRVLFRGQTLGGGLYYTYDASGRRARLRDPDGETNYYVYDSAGRLVAEQLAPGRTVYFGYDRADQLTERTLPGNAVQAYWTYDAAGRLSQLVNRNNAAGVLSSFSYTRDANGLITRVVLADGSTTYYEYDGLDRLTLEKRLSDAGATVYGFSYAYDLASNRTVKGDSVAPLSSYFSYDSRNLLTQQYDLQTNTTTSFDYDAARRMKAMRVTGSGQSAYFSHDQRDRVAGIRFARSGGGEDTPRAFGYTALDERVRVVDDGGTETYWTHDRGKLIRERGPSATLRRYRHNASCQEHLGDKLEYTNSSNPSIRFYPATNQRGDIVQFVDHVEQFPVTTNEDDALGVALGSESAVSQTEHERWGAAGGLLRLAVEGNQLYLGPKGVWAAVAGRGTNPWEAPAMAGGEVGGPLPPPAPQDPRDLPTLPDLGLWILMQQWQWQQGNETFCQDEGGETAPPFFDEWWIPTQEFHNCPWESNPIDSDLSHSVQAFATLDQYVNTRESTKIEQAVKAQVLRELLEKARADVAAKSRPFQCHPWCQRGLRYIEAGGDLDAIRQLLDRRPLPPKLDPFGNPDGKDGLQFAPMPPIVPRDDLSLPDVVSSKWSKDFQRGWIFEATAKVLVKFVVACHEHERGKEGF